MIDVVLMTRKISKSVYYGENIKEKKIYPVLIKSLIQSRIKVYLALYIPNENYFTSHPFPNINAKLLGLIV